METIYLKSTKYTSCRIACDEDTKYWIFDDSCEPIGLVCEPKENWTQITHGEYQSLQQEQRRRCSEPTDMTQAFFDKQLMQRAGVVAYNR